MDSGFGTWRVDSFLGYTYYLPLLLPCRLPVLSEDAVTSGKYNRHFSLLTVKGHVPATFYEQQGYFQGKVHLL